jgi:hypothetical protein
MPRDRGFLKRWARYTDENSTVLEHEISPISATITGNVAARRLAIEDLGIARPGHVLCLSGW